MVKSILVGLGSDSGIGRSGASGEAEAAGAADLGGGGRVPPLGARHERRHLRHAIVRAHGRHPPPHRRRLLAGDLVKQRLPPLLPRHARVAHLQRPVPPLRPAPPAHQPRRRRALAAAARRPARPALGAAQRAGAPQRRHGHAVRRRRERVPPVAQHAERQPPLPRLDAGHLQLRLERRLRVELLVARDVEARDQREPGQRDAGRVAAAGAEAVVEAPEPGPLGDDVGAAGRERVGGGERAGPEAVDPRTDHPIVREVASRFALADQVQAPFHQPKILQQSLLNIDTYKNENSNCRLTATSSHKNQLSL
jgi:hypothetical protein